jgi:hypothetical protein
MYLFHKCYFSNMFSPKRTGKKVAMTSSHQRNTLKIPKPVEVRLHLLISKKLNSILWPTPFKLNLLFTA